jgi:hypothetical protein
MKEKRQGRRTASRHACYTLITASSSSSSFPSSRDLDLDPKALRKLKNRESAARSRKKKDDLVDSLTCQLCEYWVVLDDLAAEQAHLTSFMCQEAQSDRDLDMSDLSCSSRCSSPWDDLGLDLGEDLALQLPVDLDHFL